MKALATAILLAFGVWLGVSSAALAQPDFYKGKQIRLISGHPAGGDYDIGARLLAKHLPRHVPGQPTIIVQNMLAAASIAAANYVYNAAPKDGTVIGSFSRNLASQALMGQPNIEADPRRFIWLGGFSLPSRVCVNWHTSPVQTAQDLFSKELIVAGGGATSSLSIIPTVLNHVLGTKFRVIEGYKGITEAEIATERGEVQGVCSSYAQFINYQYLVREGKLRILLHMEETPIADIPQVPSIYQFAKTDAQRQLFQFIFSSSEFGRPYVFAPGVQPERAAILRKALADVAKDPQMLAEAEKLKLDMTYISPARLEELVDALYRTPPDMIETVKKLVPNLQ